ncbi:DegP2 peptidase [Candidatus Koribacter versatilis Ellin345]|uniref:DegP2 peptidase n=1 Tax=Koribacter versatilis (strain Ellin345) TaxID=204669 RepID=Q1II85_KORVE|nr:trypsin-like peptidase domain-containing protein [Candidatus Koribacter versatilis]ABF43415.1 DegP2 peptidase [Candidatus Koribacter versatilis Ellin345]
MRKMLRPFLLGVLLATGFFYLTTHHRAASAGSDVDNVWISRPDRLELTQAAGPVTYDPEEQVNIEVYKRGLPSVVNVTSTTVAFDFFYGAVPQEGQGSGFIIDKQGHILTNFHVVQGNPQKLEITLSNRKKYPAKVIGLDRSHDLAVVQINAPDLVPAVMGDSHGLVVGQKVFAIGNPFGLSGTMTRGIISSIRAIVEPDGTKIDEAIQTDAAINPGNSGGPLLNSRGEVIGINTMIASNGAAQSAGIGFAVPINAAKAVLNDLVQYGEVRRPSLGIRGGLPITPELAEQMGLAADYGVLIQAVIPGRGADKAGLKGGNERAYLGNTPIMIGGDLIVAIGDEQIADLQDLSHAMNAHKAGETVRVTIYRAKRKMVVPVQLDEARQGA